jgi:hypothetical protein
MELLVLPHFLRARMNLKMYLQCTGSSLEHCSLCRKVLPPASRPEALPTRVVYMLRIPNRVVSIDRRIRKCVNQCSGTCIAIMQEVGPVDAPERNSMANVCFILEMAEMTRLVNRTTSYPKTGRRRMRISQRLCEPSGWLKGVAGLRQRGTCCSR